MPYMDITAHESLRVKNYSSVSHIILLEYHISWLVLMEWTCQFTICRVKNKQSGNMPFTKHFHFTFMKYFINNSRMSFIKGFLTVFIRSLRGLRGVSFSNAYFSTILREILFLPGAVIHHLTKGMNFENCTLRWFCHCTNIIECVYTS